jgi:threonine 3-dehydrogenase
MHAVVKRYRQPGARIEDVKRPVPGKGEVVVETLMSSICGTDVHIWDWNHWAQKRLRSLPIVFGHEMCGKVVELGDGVKSLREGDIVSAETHIVDGKCYQCKTDRMHICRNLRILGVDTDGVFAEYVLLPEMNARKVPPGVSSQLGSLLEPLGNATFTVMPHDCVSDVKGKNVVVTGGGPIGLMAVAILKSVGAKQVILSELASEKVRFALGRRMGADMVLDAGMGTESVVRAVKEATDGNGADVCLEMSGAAVALKQCFEMLTPGGRVSILGLYNDTVSLDVNNAITFKSATVFGITGRKMFQTWDQMYGLLKDPAFREKIASIVSHSIPMRDIEEGMRLIRTKEAAKVSLRPEW